MTVTIKFNPTLTETDPLSHPVLIVGQVKHFTQVNLYDKVRVKLGKCVTEETFKNAINYLHPSPTDTCSLYLDIAKLAALPIKSSRHNTNSRSHALTRIIRQGTIGVNESIIVVCEKQDMFASACAVARAFPMYTKKSKVASNLITVNVEFLIVDLPEYHLTSEDILCLDSAAHGIRLAARIVDMPCNEMNVSHFVEEIFVVGNALGITPVVIRGEELKEKGFGGIYGVGKAAEVRLFNSNLTF